MRVKHLLLSFLGLMPATLVVAQHVGIGTESPTRELSVNGSVVVDHDSTNYGTLFDPGLLFGSSGLTGITSSFNPFQEDYHGMSFWTSGYQRMTLHRNGNLGIGITNPVYTLDIMGSLRVSGLLLANSDILSWYDIKANDYIHGVDGLRAGSGTFSNSYKLQVNSGQSYFGGNGLFTGDLTTEGNLAADGDLDAGGDLEIDGNGVVYGYLGVQGPSYANGNLRVYDQMAIAGNVDPNYRLRVYDGDARIGGNFHATGYGAIGGSIDETYRFRVYNGNSRFGGDAQVTGELTTTDLDVVNNFTINGTGSVRSNGPSPLKISFHQVSINASIQGGSWLDYYVSLPDFSGGSGEVRVMIAQFEPDPVNPGNYWNRMTFQCQHVDDVENTAEIEIYNHGPASNIKGTLYLMVVLKDN